MGIIYTIMCSFHFWKVTASSRRGMALKSVLDIVRFKWMWSASKSFIREIRRMKGLVTRVLGLMLPAMAHTI